MAELAALAELRSRLVLAQQLNQASDQMYGSGEPARLAVLAHTVRPRVDRLQIQRLAAVAEQTESVATLLDHVEQQTGRHPEWRQEEFGRKLLQHLAALQSTAERIATRVNETQPELDEDLPRQLHVELCRRFVRHFAAAYLFGPQATPPGARGPGSQRPPGNANRTDHANRQAAVAGQRRASSARRTSPVPAGEATAPPSKQESSAPSADDEPQPIDVDRVLPGVEVSASVALHSDARDVGPETDALATHTVTDGVDLDHDHTPSESE